MNLPGVSVRPGAATITSSRLAGSSAGCPSSSGSKLAGIAKKWGVNEIAVESNFGGLEIYKQVLMPYLRKVGAECRVEAIRSNQRKELRIIDTLAPVMQTHRVAIARHVIEADADLLKNAKDDRDVSIRSSIQLSPAHA